MKIAELRDGASNVDIEAKVTEVGETREVVTKYGTATSVTNVTIEDETGTYLLVLWGKQAESLKAGATVKIKGGYVKSFRGQAQLGVPKTGKIEVA